MKTSLPIQSFFGRDEHATYSDHKLPMYKDNPLIEALPPIFSAQDVMKKLSHFPKIDPAVRSLEPELRIHAILDIEQFFQPLLRLYDLFTQLSTMIYRGYCSRNPLALNFWSNLDQGIDDIKKNNQTIEYPRMRRSLLSSSLIGISGVGKTRSIEEILWLFPQVIHHREYQGRAFTWTQLTWLKLECPHDGSTRGLALQFLQVIDDRLGTNYIHMYTHRGRASKDELLLAMARVSALHSIGILVIDEIQALSQAKSGGAEDMLNFFVQLVNLLNIPIVMVGTYKAEFLFSQAFRQARRATGHGPIRWKPIQRDEDWDLFLEALWKYQYTSTAVEFSNSFSDQLYAISQGITDIAIKVFIVTQMQAIASREEKITKEGIAVAADLALPLVRPFLDALRTNDLKRLSMMEDIEPLNIDSLVTSFLSTARQDEDISSYGKSKTSSTTAENSDSDIHSSGLLSALTDSVENDTVYDRLKDANYIGSVDDVVSE